MVILAEERLYPSQALRAMKSGAMVLQYKINKLGTATNIEILSENPEKFFKKTQPTT